MLKQGDFVEVTTLQESVKEMLATALQTEFEEIEFFFEEYDSEHYAVLTAQADTGYAVIKCPLAFIDGYYNDAQVVDELLDHVMNTLTIDYALDTGNKELFDAIIAHNKAKQLKAIVYDLPEPEQVYVGLIVDMGEEDIELLADEE